MTTAIIPPRCGLHLMQPANLEIIVLWSCFNRIVTPGRSIALKNLPELSIRRIVLVIADIYPAGEEPIEGMTSERLVDAIKTHGHKNARHVARSFRNSSRRGA